MIWAIQHLQHYLQATHLADHFFFTIPTNHYMRKERIVHELIETEKNPANQHGRKTSPLAVTKHTFSFSNSIRSLQGTCSA
jgi:hypothetical protein